MPLSFKSDTQGSPRQAFVLSILDYCDEVWTPSSTTHFKQLERPHAKFSNLRSTSCSSVSITLTEQRRYHAVIQVYRTLHKLSPPYLHDSFHYAVDITSHAARNAHRFFPPKVSHHSKKTVFIFCGTQIWNSLNPTLYTARKLANFKLLYKSLLRIYVNCVYNMFVVRALLIY